MSVQSFQQAHAQLYGGQPNQPTNINPPIGVTSFQQAHTQLMQQHSAPIKPIGNVSTTQSKITQQPQPNQKNPFLQQIGNLAQAGVTAIKNLPEFHFADTINQYTPQGFAGKATAFGAGLVQGLLNTPPEAYKGAVDLGEHARDRSSTPQQVLGDVASMVQLPLLFLTGGGSAIVKQGLVGAAKSLVEGGVKKAAAGLVKDTAIGAGFGALGGLQSGKNITNTSDYLKNFLQNVGVGAAVGGGVGTLTHVVVPLAKGASNMAGALFIKNATTKPAITAIHIDPKTAQSMVLANNLEKQPVGKAIMKESITAQQSGQHVAIIPSKDGDYALKTGQKVNVTTAPIYNPTDLNNMTVTHNGTRTAEEVAQEGINPARNPSQLTGKAAYFSDSSETADNHGENPQATINTKDFNLKTVPSLDEQQQYVKSMNATNLADAISKEGKYDGFIIPNQNKDVGNTVGITNISKLNSMVMKKVKQDPQVIGDPVLKDIANTITKSLTKGEGSYKVFGNEATAVGGLFDSSSLEDFTKHVETLSQTRGGEFTKLLNNIKSGIIDEKSYESLKTSLNQTASNPKAEEHNTSSTSTKAGKTIQSSTDKGTKPSNETGNGNAGNVKNAQSESINRSNPESSKSSNGNKSSIGEQKGNFLAQEPVGQGKTKESSAYKHRLEELASNDPQAYQYLKDKNGDVTYNVNKARDDMQKAADLLQKDLQRAYNIAMGKEKPPEGQTTTAVAIALSDRAAQDKNWDMVSNVETTMSLRGTRMGQENAALRGRFDVNSPHTFIQQVLDTRLKRLGKTDMITSGIDMLKSLGSKDKFDTARSRAIAKIDKVVDRAQQFTKKEREKINFAQNLLDQLTCK